MADNYNIYIKCKSCQGKGTINVYHYPTEEDPHGYWETITCPICEGAKEMFWGQMREEEI